LLNGRLYLQAWFVATLAILVAFLTLRAPEPTPSTTQPAQFAGSATTDLAIRFHDAAPLRVPGTIGADAGEKWIRDQFNAIPGDNHTVQSQKAVIRRNGQDVPITNVMLILPAQAKNKVQRRILVVAPRDAPRQVSWGTSGTAILVELARLSVQQKYHHPIVFMSVDGDTFGNAGLRWFLSKETASRYAGVIVLDAPGEGRDQIPVIDPETGRQAIDPNSKQPMTRPAPDANTMYLWSSGSGRQSLDMRQLAEKAVTAAGYSPSPLPSLRRQLLGLSFTETRGAQRAAIDRGIPAVTLSARRDSQLPVDLPEISRARVRAAGTATLALIGLLDDRERAKVPDRALAYAGRILRPSVARLALLFLALPLFVMALDAAGRIRRSRVRLSSGLKAVAWRMVPIFSSLMLGWLLTLWGVLHSPEVGRPPSPADLPFDGRAALALLLIVLSALALGMGVRAHLGDARVATAAETAGALAWLSVGVILAWWYVPFSLVLILPVAHAIVAASLAPRLWQIGLLALSAVLVPLALVLRIAGVIDRSPLYALWYITETTLSGARGLAGPVIGAIVVVALGTLCIAIVRRIRDGLVQAGDLRKGIGWLTSNLSARKRPLGATDGDSAEKT
jgi:hypothetical protein